MVAIPEHAADELIDIAAAPLPRAKFAAPLAGSYSAGGFIPDPSPQPVAYYDPAKVDARCRCGHAYRFDPDDVRAGRTCPSCGTKAGSEGSYLLYPPTIQRVHLVDAELPFGSMMILALKWTFAIIPAAIVIGCAYAAVVAVMSGVGR